MLLTLLSPRRVLQALSGVLTASGTVALVPKTPLAIGGALTMSGAISPRLIVTKSVSGTLTGSGTVATQYTPPQDLLLLLLRRNQTD
jgi:hypothetical protein